MIAELLKAEDDVTRWSRRLKLARTKLKKAKAALARLQHKACPKPVSPELLAEFETACAAEAAKPTTTVNLVPDVPLIPGPTSTRKGRDPVYQSLVLDPQPMLVEPERPKPLRHNPDLDAMFL